MFVIRIKKNMSDKYEWYDILPSHIRDHYIHLNTLSDLYQKLNMDFLVDITRKTNDVICHKMNAISDVDFMHNIIIQLELSRVGIMSPISSYGYNNSVWILNVSRYKWTLFDYLSSLEWKELEESMRTKKLQYIMDSIFISIYKLVKYKFNIGTLTSHDFILSENLVEIYIDPLKIMYSMVETNTSFIIDIVIGTFQKTVSQIIEIENMLHHPDLGL